MSRVCEKCGKGTTSGSLRSHSNIRTRRLVGANLQSKKIDGEKVKICTKCIKTLAKK